MGITEVRKKIEVFQSLLSFQKDDDVRETENEYKETNLIDRVEMFVQIHIFLKRNLFSLPDVIESNTAGCGFISQNKI